jgi:anti-anti-sigma regulatory factor
MEVVVSEKTQSQAVLCIQLKGQLDETNAIALSDRLLNICPNPVPGTVQIDLSGCPSICNQGFAALVSFRLSTLIAEHPVEIFGQNLETDRRMRILRLDQLFQMSSPLDEPHVS